MPSFAQYWQALALALDDLELHTITAQVSADLTSAATLVNATTGASDSLYDERWAYISAGVAMGTATRVKPGGYVPAAGTLAVSPVWNTAPRVGDTLALTGLFPARPGLVGAEANYHDLVNRALRLLNVPDHLDITTVAGQQEYALGAYPWLDRPERATMLLDPPRAAGFPRPPSRIRNWALKTDAGAPTLQLFDRGYPASGATFQLVVLRPAWTLINGADSTTGLVAESDTAVPTVEDVTTVGLMLACEALMNRSPGRPNGDWHTRWAEHSELARRLQRYDRTRELIAEAPAGNASRAVLPSTTEAA